MKKLLALILAAALALSLVACGGGSGAGDNNTPSGGNGDTTSTDTPSGGITKEEMLEVATELETVAINNAYKDNKLGAQDTYIGKIYKFEGTVEKIMDNFAIIIPNDSPLNGSLQEVDVFVYLPRDELKTLSTNDSVSIVGEISDISLFNRSFGTTIIMENNCNII